MNNINIFALGGLDEYGKSMYCIEIDYKIFIVNCGIKRGETSQFGVDYVIPDFTYVIENKERIAGVIITHMHDDMMEALPYLLKKINVPVYATKTIQVFIRNQYKKHGIKDYRLYELPRCGEIKIDGVKVKTFGLTHSTPDAIGVALATPEGYIVVAEQYVVDFDIHNEMFNCDIGAISDIGSEGVFCALIESRYANQEGFTAPKHRVTNILKPVFDDAEGRIFVTVYGQNYLRINEIVALAASHNRMIYFMDEQLRENILLLEDNKYSFSSKKCILSNDQITNDMENVVIVVTDFGSQIFEKMRKIALGEDSLFELRETDTVIIASPIVSGTEKVASTMENELYQKDVNIFKLDSKQVLSVHPSQEDMKMFISILKPKYFIPVMGNYYNFVSAADLAVGMGMTPDKIVILDNGQVASFVNGNLKSTATMIESVGDVLINDTEKKDITSFVLKDRELLATDGVIILGVTIDFKTKRVIAGPDVQSRGVIYVKDSEYLISNVGKLICEVIEEKVKDGTYNNADARVELRERVSRYVFRETGKRPMILPAIIEINLN